MTNRIVRLLYGPNHGSDNITSTLGSYSISLDLENDICIHMWHRMSNLVDFDLLSPGNFCQAILGVGKVIDALHFNILKQNLGTNMVLPEGNTVLDMFGSILFRATSKSSEFAEGKAAAFGILCRIFCNPQSNVPFRKTYLEQFYVSVASGLNSDSYSICTIFLNCGSLFSIGLDGALILVPHFVLLGVPKILPIIKPDFKIIPSSNADDVRMATYALIGEIISIPNRFPMAPAFDLVQGQNLAAKFDFSDDFNDDESGGLLQKLVHLFNLDSISISRRRGLEGKESDFSTIKNASVE